MALQAETPLCQQRLKIGMLRLAQVQHILTQDRAELDEPNPVRLQAVNLLDRVGGNLVGEGTQANHGGVGLRR